MRSEGVDLEASFQPIFKTLNRLWLYRPPFVSKKLKCFSLIERIGFLESLGTFLHHPASIFLTDRILMKTIDPVEDTVLNANIAVDRIHGRLQPLISVDRYHFQLGSANSSVPDASQEAFHFGAICGSPRFLDR